MQKRRCGAYASGRPTRVKRPIGVPFTFLCLRGYYFRPSALDEEPFLDSGPASPDSTVLLRRGLGRRPEMS